MSTTALIIGRFQPFHLGHVRLIEEAAKEADHILIGVGSSQEDHTKNNPFTAREREEMIKRSLKDGKKYSIYEIPDIGNDKRWVSHVAGIVPSFDVVYTNGALERKLFAEAGCRVHATGLYNREKYAGTEIRRRIVSGEPWEDLVPEGTLEVMEKTKGVERIRVLG
jgi:nicotinamide-nucleotide adenylyltransferase